MKVLCFTLVLMAPVLVVAQPDSLWSRWYGQPTVGESVADVRVTPDGGIIIAGVKGIGVVGEQCDAMVIKTNTDGDTLWTRTYGGVATSERFHSVLSLADGSYALAGETEVLNPQNAIDMWLVCADSNGLGRWSHSYGGSNSDACAVVVQCSDGGFALGGFTTSYGPPYMNVYLVKTDSMGARLWSRVYGGDFLEHCSAMQQTRDGGFMLAGTTLSFGAGSGDFWLIKTDANGDSMWSHTYGTTITEECYTAFECSDGGYLLAGTSYFVSDWDTEPPQIYVVKTDSLGTVQWDHTFSFAPRTVCYTACETLDHGFAIGGAATDSTGDMGSTLLLKSNADGQIEWSCNFVSMDNPACTTVRQLPDGSFLLAGTRELMFENPDRWDWDIFLMKTGPDPELAAPPTISLPVAFALFQNYPNPFNPTTRISFALPKAGMTTLRVYDLLGREVSTLLNRAVQAGEHTVSFDASHLASGIYFYRLVSGNFTATKKMVLLK